MNCRPGDLAIIINGDEAPENVGAIVEVLQSVPPCECGCMVGALWRVESRGRKLVGWNIFNMRLQGDRIIIPDSHLRPIRPQADDAVDETVRQVGVAPMTLTEILQGEVTS